jgi:hypothetical protein
MSPRLPDGAKKDVLTAGRHHADLRTTRPVAG